MLCANMALNSIQNADCKQLGVGSTREIIEVAFIDPETENNFGGLSLKDHSIEKVKEETGAVDLHGEKVAVCRIDDIGLNQCDFIKIDVEGFEMEVLKGATETIKNTEWIMIELNNNTKRYGSSNLEIEKYLPKLGFRTLIKIWPDVVYRRK